MSHFQQVFALVTSDLYDPTPVPIRGKSDAAMELGCSKKMRLSETCFFGVIQTFLFCNCISCSRRVVFVWYISWFCLTSPSRSFSFWLKRPSGTFFRSSYSCSKSYSSAFAEMGLKTTGGLVLRRENFPESILRLSDAVLRGYPTHLQQA